MLSSIALAWPEVIPTLRELDVISAAWLVVIPVLEVLATIASDWLVVIPVLDVLSSIALAWPEVMPTLRELLVAAAAVEVRIASLAAMSIPLTVPPTVILPAAQMLSPSATLGVPLLVHTTWWPPAIVPPVVLFVCL